MPEIVSCSHDKQVHKWALTHGEHWEQEPIQWRQVGSPYLVMGIGTVPEHIHHPSSTWSPLTWEKSNQDMAPAGTYTKAMC